MRNGTPQVAGYLLMPFLFAVVVSDAVHAKQAADDQAIAQASETETNKSISSSGKSGPSDKASATQTDTKSSTQTNDKRAGDNSPTVQSSPESGANQTPAKASTSSKSEPFYISIGDLIGKWVRDNEKSGQFVGRLSSLVIDTVSGDAVYAIIDRGGLFGFGQTHVVVPFELVVFPGRWGNPILKVSSMKLDNAPQIVDRDLESLLHDSEWRRSVADYYGLRPSSEKPKLAESTATPTKQSTGASKEAAITHGQSIVQTICATCHTSNKGGGTLVGPNLFGVVGRPIASLAEYSYSPALKKRKGNWTPKNLDAWLKNPSSYAPGTLMTFAGLKSDRDREDVIDYLESLKPHDSPSR